MNPELLNLYRLFRRHSPFMLVGHNAELALSSARTLLRFRELEDAGLVRIDALPEEESYFSVYGEPDTEKEREEIERMLDLYGCYYVTTDYLDERDDWQHADGVGMCTGYEDPVSPFENCYVVQLMAAAVAKAEERIETARQTMLAEVWP